MDVVAFLARLLVILVVFGIPALLCAVILGIARLSDLIAAGWRVRQITKAIGVVLVSLFGGKHGR